MEATLPYSTILRFSGHGDRDLTGALDEPNGVPRVGDHEVGRFDLLQHFRERQVGDGAAREPYVGGARLDQQIVAVAERSRGREQPIEWPRA